MSAGPLAVHHTVSYRDEPLLCFTNLPGPDPVMTPAAARLLAGALLRAAADCERLAKDARRYGPQRREYALAAPVSTPTPTPTHEGGTR